MSEKLLSIDNLHIFNQGADNLYPHLYPQLMLIRIG